MTGGQRGAGVELERSTEEVEMRQALGYRRIFPLQTLWIIVALSGRCQALREGLLSRVVERNKSNRTLGR